MGLAADGSGWKGLNPPARLLGSAESVVWKGLLAMGGESEKKGLLVATPPPAVGVACKMGLLGESAGGEGEGESSEKGLRLAMVKTALWSSATSVS